MPTTAEITVAILAGGAATRLGGRDKGLELLGGRPLIERVVAAVAQMDAPAHPANVVIVANRHLAEYARCAPVLRDLVGGFRGPLAGVATALAKCPTAWLLTVPVDCPDPPHDLARRFCHALHEGGADALVARDGERRQPLFALYRRELAGSAAQAVTSSQGVHQWQESIGAREVDFHDRRQQFHNLNTFEDFAAYAESPRFPG